MSTIAVNAITNAAGGNTATINSMTPTAQSLQGFRNRIINGDMRIDQRNAGAAVTLTGIDSEFPVDRFKFTSNTTASLALQQVADAPQGFVNSLKATVNTAGAVPPAVGVWMEQPIEGLNVSDLGWGTANAQAVTVSFWVKSTLTGTFGAALQNSARNRSYPFTYAISVANTWEQKTVTIPGDTTGTWLTTNGTGIFLNYDLGLAASFRGTAGAWAAADNRGVTGAVSVIGTLSATWQVTGVQLEAGSVATPFERRDYGRELMMCQRYFELTSPVGSQAATNACYGNIIYFVPKRTAPTYTLRAAGLRWIRPAGFDITSTGALSISDASINAVYFAQTVTGAIAGAVTLVSQNSLEVNSEL